MSRGHFHAVASFVIFIDLPESDSKPGMIGPFSQTIYGARDAPSAWELYYREVLETLGFRSGSFLFIRVSDGTRVWVHGDDKILVMETQLKEHVLIKRCALLGLEPWAKQKRNGSSPFE